MGQIKNIKLHIVTDIKFTIYHHICPLADKTCMTSYLDSPHCFCSLSGYLQRRATSAIVVSVVAQNEREDKVSMMHMMKTITKPLYYISNIRNRCQCCHSKRERRKGV